MLLLPLFPLAQVLEQYPYGQEYYRGGRHTLQEEMKQIAKTQNLKPCADEEEHYIMSVLVHPNGKGVFVKDFDSLMIYKNKCAYDMSRKLLPHLKGWMAPKVDGILFKAIATVNVIPYNLFNERPKVLRDKIVNPQYNRGYANFHFQVKDILERSLTKNMDRRRVSLAVVISPQGIVEDVKVNDNEISEISKKKLITRIKAIKGTWSPATLNGVPVRFTLYMNFHQEFNFEMEKKQFDSYDRPYRGI